MSVVMHHFLDVCLSAPNQRYTGVTLRMSKFLAAALLLVLTQAVVAEDFSIVLDPATGLKPDSPAMSDRLLTEKEPRLLRQYSPLSEPKRFIGSSLKDAPDTKSFILLFEKPSSVSYRSIQLGYPTNAPGKLVRVPYTGIVAVQPFSLWHLSDAGDKPTLLGRGFYWGRATPIKITKPGSEPEFVFVNRSVEEMTHLAVANQFSAYPSLLADCWSPNVVVQKPTLNVTPQRILEWGRRPTAPPSAFDRPIKSNEFFTPAASLVVRTTYKPSRFSKDPDGNPVAELDLDNRLPVAAHGSLECRQEYSATHRDNHTATPPRVLKQSIRYRFHLQPGEKAVAKFPLPPGTDSRTLADLVIEVSPQSSYLGDYLKKSESPPKPEPAKRRRKK